SCLELMQKDPKHLVLAHLFDKPCFLGLLAVQVIIHIADHKQCILAHIPKCRMIWLYTEFNFQDIGAFFMDVVNSSHSYATGGTSVSEFW
ncbi:hypothetical protein BHE74_00023065, partial [Ensete ventricosum]